MRREIVNVYFERNDMRLILSSCPGLTRASTSSLSSFSKSVDGRDKPGHDEGSRTLAVISQNPPKSTLAPMVNRVLTSPYLWWFDPFPVGPPDLDRY
jgi:hypothetical protein